MPSKLGSDLGLPEVDRVHTTGIAVDEHHRVSSAAARTVGNHGERRLGAAGPYWGSYVSAGLVLGGYTVGPDEVFSRADLTAIARATGAATDLAKQAALYGLSYGAAAAGVPQLASAATTLGGLTYSARGGMPVGQAMDHLAAKVKFSGDHPGRELVAPDRR